MTASSSRVSVAAVVPVQSYPMTLFSGRTLVGHVDRSIRTRFARHGLPASCLCIVQFFKIQFDKPADGDAIVGWPGV